MRFPLSDADIPEFSGLSISERRQAKSRALKDLVKAHPVTGRAPLVLTAVLGGMGWLSSALVVALVHPLESRAFSGDLLILSGIFSMVGLCAGGSLGAFLGDQFLIRKLRHFLRATGSPDSRSEAAPRNQ